MSQLIICKSAFVKQKLKDINEDYKLEKELGQGSYGIVYQAVHLATEDIRAVKQIKRAKITNQKRFINEIEALKKLDHPNIVKLYEIYEDEECYYLVQELCTGGELYDRIVETEALTEQFASILFRQILQAILYCHKNKIGHRDLKPENFVFKTRKEDSVLKLIDFGLSRSFAEDDKDDGTSKKKMVRMGTQLGTTLFMAPEVYRRDYSESCDMWSAGVILYVMLGGYPPFFGDDEKEVIQHILKGEYEFEDEAWDIISADAKNLIQKGLLNEEDRITVK